MPPTLILINPGAGSGRAGKIWQRIEAFARQHLGPLDVVTTTSPQDVTEQLRRSFSPDLTRVIAVGGDGTAHVAVNALMALREEQPEAAGLAFGLLPIGTGSDWARTLQTPTQPEAAVRWLAAAQPCPTDLGQVSFDGRTEYFLNIASAGLGGEVDEFVNRRPRRRPWTFLLGTVVTLLTYQPQQVQILLDGALWYEGRIYAVAVANGRAFGHGMLIAPHAETDDGLLDVILVEGMPRLAAILALRQVYDGSHLTHPRVRSGRAREVQMKTAEGTLGLDLDGEGARGADVHFRLLPGALQVLS